MIKTSRNNKSRLSLKLFITAIVLMTISSGLLAQKKVNLQGIETGMAAPEFELPKVDGETFNLSDLRGKVVLINFWASWCAPCRKKAPALLDIYEKYHQEEFDNGENGFEIVCVSLDKNEIAWKNSIKKDQIDVLLNVGDMKGWKSAAARAYSIKRIPTMVLLNGEGEIVALDLSTKDLTKKLKRMKKSSWFW